MSEDEVLEDRPSAVLSRESGDESIYAGASPEAIRYHYDFGTDFFQLWLDPELVYSAGRWSGVTDRSRSGLADAQLAKLDYHLDQVRAGSGCRLLDIGCGWGALLTRALQERRAAAAVGLTLSDDQHRHVVANADGAQCLLSSYEQFVADERFDGAVSIGAMEHFAKPGLSRRDKLEIYGRFFDVAHRSLRPGGRLSVQTVCWGPVNRATSGQFLPLDIFPESDVPFPDEVLEASQPYFEPLHVENGREDYILTLEAWLRNLRLSRDIIVQKFGGENVFVYYEKYLRRAIGGFRRRRMLLMRFTFERTNL
jgi:cyclopropane-fatty-acyl-phospholipid synthase